MPKATSQFVLLKYLMLVMLVLAFIAGGIVFVVLNQQGTQEEQIINAVSEVDNTVKLADGGTLKCSRIPPFIAKMGLKQPVAIDTAQSIYPGLVIREIKHQQRLFQHPSWLVTGHVGSTVRDAYGNIYVIPVPSVGLDTNPMDRRNIVYKIDANSAVMKPLINLPLSSDSSLQNPFGTMGIAFDCDTNSLYVSSVAGSTPLEEKGALYQIDLNSQQIVSRWEGVDAIGLAVFNVANKKRLYFGSARTSSVFSVPLNQQGAFLKPQSEPQYELSLLAIKNGNSTQARKLKFSENGSGEHILTIVETEFAFRMTADTGRRFKHYPFVFNKEKGEWIYSGN